MRGRRKNLLTLLIFSLALILALISCKTCPKEDNTVPMPSFPAFPSPMVDGVAVVRLDVAESVVTMPYWYWKDITKYVIDTEAAIERLRIDLGGFK